MPFHRWKRRLAGERVATFLLPDLEDEGYYRRPVIRKLTDANGKPSGRKEIIGWIPVAIFVEYVGGGKDAKDVLRGLIGIGSEMRNMTNDELKSEEFWSWIVAHPIEYKIYKAVAEDGEPWPDSSAERLKVTMPAEQVSGDYEGTEDDVRVPAAGREVARSDNSEPEKELPLDVKHRNAITSAVGVAKAFVVTSEATAAQGLGIKNRLAELRLSASRAGEAIYKPLHTAYVTEREKWLPMVNQADVEEKALNTKILTWRETERKRLAAEAVKAAAKAAEEARVAAVAEAERLRLEQEENERAADRAIARGEPEVPPVIAETEAPPVAPVVAAASTPAPAPLRPTYGTRKLKEEEKTFIDEVTDWSALFAHFKDNEAVQVTLKTLALQAVRNGLTVPGVTTRRGLI